MDELQRILSEASRLRAMPSMLIKSALGREVARELAAFAGLVLQGGGALHHIYGSPRFSADLDYAQIGAVDEGEFQTCCERIRGLVEAAWGACELAAPVHKGKLHRIKLRVPIRAGTVIVLAIERYETPVHHIDHRPLSGEQEVDGLVPVEAIAEIMADKIVASIDRMRTRGAIKLRDAFDIDFLLQRCTPDRALVLAKLADYGLPLDLSPLTEIASLLDALAAAELEEQLRGVLPDQCLSQLDTSALVERVRRHLSELAE